MSNYKERNFEEAVELDFIDQDFKQINTKDYDKEHGFFIEELFQFIQHTQEKQLTKYQSRFGKQDRSIFIDSLSKTIETEGLLTVLRNGLNSNGFHFDLMYFKPNTTINEKIVNKYKQNIFGVTRQHKYSLQNENSIDIVVSINGFPIITMELKNEMTGQNVENAKVQYQEDRSPKELALRFNRRSLVHFAVDTELVYMTTKLEEKKTFFLPFNKGYNDRAGNPPSTEHEYATSYLWKEVLDKDSLLDILQRFMHHDVEEKDGIIKEKLIFPRYHQLDVVRKLEQECKEYGVGKSFLIQHSAGSGKSNSISWLAHRLSTLHSYQNESVFDTIIVVTDRRALDRQISHNISQFEKVDGIVKWANKKSTDLKTYIEDKEKIIVTTIHKFAYILENLKQMKQQRYAVIIDEAHSSQTGENAEAMKKVLQGFEKKENNGNISFFAFTATPKKATLRMFGIKTSNKDGYEPYHVYSMQQAIDEGFIQNVLSCYTTYETYYTVRAKSEQETLFDTRQVKTEARKLANSDDRLIETKVNVMLYQYWNKTRHKMNGKAKAMLVTESRKQAALYKMEFEKQIQERGYDGVKVIVAFSDSVTIDREKYTEEDMNGFKESELPRKFNTDDYQILIVANKYQTGFDQPLLHTMFVDKRLQDVNAVQTLSRLNRMHPLKEDTFVLDFKNKIEEIQESFSKYCVITKTNYEIDFNVLYTMKKEILDYQCFSEEDIQLFCEEFDKKEKSDHKKLNEYIQVSKKKYNELEKEQKEKFKSTSSSFNNSCSYIMQVLNIEDRKLKRFHIFLRILRSAIRDEENIGTVHIEDIIEIEHLRLFKTGDHVLEELEIAEQEEGEGTKNGQNVKTISPLEEIVQQINETFEMTLADQKYHEFFQYVLDKANADERVVGRAKQNAFKEFFETNDFREIYDGVLASAYYDEGLTHNVMEVSEEILGNIDLSDMVLDKLASQFYKDIHRSI